MFRRSRRLLSFLIGAALFTQAGCSDDNPLTPATEEPPVLPAPERLAFDFSFFQEPSALERASQNNFFNAYVRAAVMGAITQYLLTPPVTAFSLALHTVPSPQADGSYLWVYTWVDGDEEAQIRLRGTPESDSRVVWELRASSTEDGFENELWFEGETWKDGAEGLWRFHDFEKPGKPIVARLEWGSDVDGEFLRFVDAYENVDDSLEYRENGALRSFTYTDADAGPASWFVKWNESDGSGSLRAPDYNGGVEACWDDDQDDAVCPPAL